MLLSAPTVISAGITSMVPVFRRAICRTGMLMLISAAAIVAVSLAAGLVVIRRKRKAKKELEELEGSDDEIS